MRFRQIHLDFHTSEKIPGIGSDFTKKEFQERLKLGHVNSINIFAKCHHGWSYHPTEVEYSAMHPHLNFDLLGSMVEACHEIDVKCPVYISAGLDEKLVRQKSEWLMRGRNDEMAWVGWTKPGYHTFCLNSPYLYYLIEQTEEVIRNYDIDGVWLDIVSVRPCWCQYCLNEMEEKNIDLNDDKAIAIMARNIYINYTRSINNAIHAIKPGLPIYHNGGHIVRGDRELASFDTHLELESLPTGGWGYDHFPLSARYSQQLSRDYIGMTGKFHTTWGEFGGYKHPNALRYESALSLANGAKISVGDQLHPRGVLDYATYDLIGKAFSEVEMKEEWCDDVDNFADVALLSSEAVREAIGFIKTDGAQSVPVIDEGAVRTLLEGHLLFDVIDLESDFNKYKVVIIPDFLPARDDIVKKIKDYLSNGGKIFASNNVLINDNNEFAIDFGAKIIKEGEYSPTYLRPLFELKNWANAAFVNYSKAKNLELTGGEAMVMLQNPYFNREFRHFTSHQHASSTNEDICPIMVKTDNTVYFGIPAFANYFEMGQNVLRDIILEGINSLLKTPTLTSNLPAVGVQTVQKQKAKNRTIVHLLYAPPSKRGNGIEVIEDLPVLTDINISLQVEGNIKRVYLAPQNEDLNYELKDGTLTANIPPFSCHQMIVIE